MAEIRKTNIFQYLKTKYNNVASIGVCNFVSWCFVF